MARRSGSLSARGWPYVSQGGQPHKEHCYLGNLPVNTATNGREVVFLGLRNEEGSCARKGDAMSWAKTSAGWATVGTKTESENRDYALAEATSTGSLTINLKSEASGMAPGGAPEESSDAKAAWEMAWKGSAQWGAATAAQPTDTTLVITISGSVTLSGDSEDKEPRVKAAASASYSVSMGGRIIDSGSLFDQRKAGFPDFNQSDDFTKVLRVTLTHTRNYDFVVTISGQSSCSRDGYDSKANGKLSVTGTLNSFS